MIILRMSGGLGNQMFQYALYLQLVRLGRRVSFDDKTEYRAARSAADVVGNARPIALPVFGIRYPVCSAAELSALTDADPGLSARIRRKLLGRKSQEVHDEDFVFDPSFLTRESGYYAGCFQSPLYFRGVEEEVRQSFTFPGEVMKAGWDPGCAGIRPLTEAEAAANQAILEQIRKAPRACAVHLRFGDYLTKSRVYGGITTDAYYRTALQLVRERWKKAAGSREEPVFFLFSNDPEKAEAWSAKITGGFHFVIVRGNDEAHGYVDLCLMSQCQDYVIANSSFSFWGAWLGTGRRKDAASAAGGRQQTEMLSAQERQQTGEESAQREWQRRNRALPGITIAPTYWVNDPEGKELRRTDIFPAEWLRVSPRGEWLGEDRPLVSVIVAAYNIERYIRRALTSLQEQTLQEMEFLVVDDGSTDRTGQICDEFAAKDARFHVIHQANGGLSAARNSGLAVARGQWIGYLDGDDAAAPWMYESLLTAGVYAGADVALCAFEEKEDTTESPLPEEGNDNHGQQVRAAVREGTVLSREQALEIYVRSGVADVPDGINFYNSVWSKLFRKEVVKDLRFPVGHNSEDILYTTRALLGSRRVVYLPAKLYRYTKGREGSIMNVKLGERRLNDEIPFYEEQIRLFRKAAEEEDPSLGIVAEKAVFYLARRVLFYWDDFDQAQDAAARRYADRLEKLLLDQKELVEKVVRKADYARRGDRVRLRLFLQSPARYRRFRDLYARAGH